MRAGKATSHASAAYNDDNSQVFDQSPAAVEVDNSQSQAAIDASDQAMQQEDQSLQDMDASMRQPKHKTMRRTPRRSSI